jgi:hypothetical protein
MAWYTVKTYHKKNVEQHEYFRHSETGASILVKDGFRFAEYNVETSDDNPPEFNFTQCPGGNEATDSIDLNSCFGDNVESTDLVEMFDGGCWGDIEIEGVNDEEEEDRLRELIESEGSYALEEDGDGEWYLDETEVWVWGPLEITNDEGYHRIVVADADGNVIDFKEEE